MLRYFYSLLFVVPFLLSGNLSGQYVISERCLDAWEKMMNLEVESARKIIEKELQENPTNYYAYYLGQTNEFIELLGNPSEEAYSRFLTDYQERREIMDGKETTSPYYMACESDMMLQTGIANTLYGDKLSGVRRSYKAYRLTYDNLDEFPDFWMSKKNDGFFNVSLTNLPPFVRWAASFFGVKGDLEAGFGLLFNNFLVKKDTRGLNAAAVLYLVNAFKLNKDPGSAYKFIRSLDSSIRNYRLVSYFYGNTAYRSGHNEEAYRIFREFDLDGVEMTFPPYDYMMARILMRRLDPGAIKYIEKYLQTTRNENYLKEMNYYTALYWLINGDRKKFEYYRKVACTVGKEIQERDREAMYECELDYVPDAGLVKARLLMDGGYFEKADSILENCKPAPNDILPFQLEYNLLKGRYADHKKLNKTAIAYYKKVIRLGKDEDYYFASDAAFRLGFIYKKTDRQKAIEYFEMARDLYEKNFYEYIDEISAKQLLLLSRED
ncbi:MAG: hypothetical protein GXO86_00085 [Chlorobi bacterium]|nr:hypothetical protein [Chlorobiota bacterium]